MTYYAIADDTAIYAIGQSEDAVTAAAREALGPEANIPAPQECSISLYYLVQEEGGAVAWGEIDGVLCTEAEEDDDAIAGTWHWHVDQTDPRKSVVYEASTPGTYSYLRAQMQNPTIYTRPAGRHWDGGRVDLVDAAA